MANVTFLGACGCVTGSSTLLAWGDTRVLVDCGMFQGGEELEQRNWAPFAFRPADLAAVVLTHAHLDHVGLLPKLVKHGFHGPIYCTRPSRALVSLVLEDAGKIQEEQTHYAREKGYTRHADPQPLYDRDDAKRVLALVQPIRFDHEFEIVPGVRAIYSRAGHLLGAASVSITAKDGEGRRRTWCFSGDVGRYGVPILKDPEPPAAAPDVLLLESTYGDRAHPQVDVGDALGEVIRKTFARGGSVIVPAFAIGRSQDLLYHLAELAEAGKVDPRAVFLDSPMAVSATRIYDQAEGEHDEDLQDLDDTIDPLGTGVFQHCSQVAQSKALNARKEPAVIIASSGMATAGRVVHHLLHRLGDRRNSVVLVGYQAPGTRGRALLEGADTVAIHGRRVAVEAEIHNLQGLSAHGDRNELLRWANELPGRPSRIYLNHGEDTARKALSVMLEEDGWPRAGLPLIGDTVPW